MNNKNDVANFHSSLSQTQNLSTSEDLKLFTSSELLSRTRGLVADERRATVLLISHLEEIQNRRLFAKIGFSSMWEFCTKYLKLSEGAAQRRIQAMRLLQRLPETQKEITRASIESGNLSLSNASSLQSFLLAETKRGHSKTDVQDLITQATGVSQQELQAKLCEISPEKTPTERTRVVSAKKDHELKFTISDEVFRKLQQIKGLIAHKLPNASFADLVEYLANDSLGRLEKKNGIKQQEKTKTEMTTKAEAAPTSLTHPTSARITRKCQSIRDPKPADHLPASQLSTTAVRSAIAESYDISYDISGDTSSHAIALSITPHQTLPTPPTTAAAAVTIKDHSSRPLPAGKRVYLPVKMRRAVFERAQGRCEYTYEEIRCSAKYSLELDHIVPLTHNGSNELENVRLLCKAHNLQQAVEKIGIRIQARIA